MPTTKPTPVAMGERDACDRIGIRRSKLWMLARAGKISTAKIGSRTVFIVASLDALVLDQIATAA